MEDREERIKRYFKNANRFIWGLSKQNQKTTYEYLGKLGFNDHGTTFKGSYSDVSQKMVDQYGVEKILRILIQTEVKKIFTPGYSKIPELRKNPELIKDPEYIRFLRKHWLLCIHPTLAMLKAENLDKFVVDEEFARYDGIFLSYNKQYKFVEGWGELAPIWFEEIEPYLKEKVDKNEL